MQSLYIYYVGAPLYIERVRQLHGHDAEHVLFNLTYSSVQILEGSASLCCIMGETQGSKHQSMHLDASENLHRNCSSEPKQ